MSDYWQDYFKNVYPTWMESWYEQLQDLTIKSVCFRLGSEEIEALLNLADGDEDLPIIEGIKKKLWTAFAKLEGDQVFVRLGSRSPKDNLRNMYSPEDVLIAFSDSERILEDLTLCKMIKYLPFVFVREWVDIPRKSEFRCFVKDQELKGISQYYYREKYYYLDELGNRELIELQAKKMLTAMLQHGLELRNFVFDIVYKENDDLPLLVEINPFSSWTDPCLFDWVLDKFNVFEFRWFQVAK